MKKITLLTLFALFCSTATWGQIPNSGFESWSTIPNDNHLTHFRSDDKESEALRKYQPAHGGNYALKLTTIPSSENPAQPHCDIVLNSFTPNPMNNGGGVPYSQQPTKMFVYAKYDVKTGDEANIGVAFKKNGVALTGLFDNVLKITGSQTAGYQKLELPISGLTQTPDTVVLFMISCDIDALLENPGAITPQIGTYIIIDDISFDTTDPIPYMGFEEWGRPVVLPDSWMAPNSYEVVVALNATNPLVKTTAAHSGNSALLVKPYFNAYMDLPQDQYQAFVTTGDYGGWENVKKFPCTTQKGYFTGYYKYLPSNAGENANISISFYKNGNLVDYGMGVDITTASSTYKQFSVPFDLTEQPDMAQINIVSNTTVTKASLGTELYVDDLNITANNNPISYNPSVVYQNSENIEIIYNAALGNAALKDYAGDVYIHTGVVLTSSPNDWSHGPAAWGDNSPKYKCERLGANIYRIVIPNLKDYYGLLDGEVVSKIAFVFRNSEATKAGKTSTNADFFIDVQSTNTTALVTTNEKPSFNVFPNPANDVIKIDGITETSNLEIIDVQGTCLMRLVVENGAAIDIYALNTGVYILKLSSENKVAKVKLLKK